MPGFFVSFRKTTWVSLFLLIGIPFVVSFKQNVKERSPEEFCREMVLKNITKIISSLKTSENSINIKAEHADSLLILEYRRARKYYKEIEFFIEYYSAFDAKYFINGPLVPKNEIEFGPIVYEPQGFQVIEDQLFSKDKFNSEELLKQYKLLSQKFDSLFEYYSTVTLEQANLNEALQLEVIRIMCLTLNGYDCTINKESLTECASSVSGIVKVLGAYKNVPADSKVYKKAKDDLNNCIKQLLKDTDSDKFDRLFFITRHLNPAYKNLTAFLVSMNVPSSQVNYAVKLKQVSLFTISNLNKQHFSIYRYDTLNNKEQASLGKLLFFDPLLSNNNKRACASCHQPNMAFTDGLDKSIAFDNKNKISRNAPTLLNSSLQKLFFYDGRAFNLEEQADNVFHNEQEMKMSKEDIISKLKQSSEYKQLFKKAFVNSPDTIITFYAVIKSIAEYIKTLESKNSRFDKYISGNYSTLNKHEISGFNLFNGKALCGSCHFFPVFNGTVPPMFNDSEFEVIGTPTDSTNKIMDDDIGREAVSKKSIHKFAFKTPTLRNIALTAPYMHNGAYSNLDQVLEFYNKGGGAGLKFKVENQTLPFDSLGLTKTELKDIKSFLLTLTDTTNLTSVPKRLPKIDNSRLNARKIGGEY
ncbi:MAG: cytochrome c peroxidase [Bacteroidota bacterium]|nr:cytochrome c peroxidase [Bacteroidota bacterium]